MDSIEKLERLQRLRDAKVLTEDEFQIQKGILLGNAEPGEAGDPEEAEVPDSNHSFDDRPSNYLKKISIAFTIALMGIVLWFFYDRNDVSESQKDESAMLAEYDHTPSEAREVSFDKSDFNVYSCGKLDPIFLYFNSQLLDENMEMPYHLVKNGKEVTNGYSILGSTEVAFNAVDIRLDYDDLRILDADERGILVKFVGTQERVFVYRDGVPVPCRNVDVQ